MLLIFSIGLEGPLCILRLEMSPMFPSYITGQLPEKNCNLFCVLRGPRNLTSHILGNFPSQKTGCRQGHPDTTGIVFTLVSLCCVLLKQP